MLLAAAAVIAGAVIAILTIPGGKHHPRTRRAGTVRAGGGSRNGQTALAASYLGENAGRLRNELRAGGSLAEIAGSSGGRSTEGLVEALVRPRVARIERELAAGKLSKQVANVRIARLRRRARERVKRATAPQGSAAVAASYLGLSLVRLREQQSRGRSLADVAAAVPGRSAAGLASALTKADEALLEKMIRSGALTAARGRALLATLPERVTGEIHAHARSLAGGGVSSAG